MYVRAKCLDEYGIYGMRGTAAAVRLTDEGLRQKRYMSFRLNDIFFAIQSYVYILDIFFFF